MCIVLTDREIDPGIGKGKPLNPTDFSNARKIGILESSSKGEEGGGFEGDIILARDQKIALEMAQHGPIQKAVWENAFGRQWPKVGPFVQVAYVISSSYDSDERAKIAKAVIEFEEHTCVR